MPDEPVLLTKAGLERLEDELHELKTVRRAEVAAMIREAQELGPDQLDAQYEDAKNQQAFLEGRISEIERILEQASVIDEASARKSKEVQVGSTVTVKPVKGSAKSRKFQLVGPTEADPTEGRISHKSPMGRALLGKKRGEKVTIKAPAGETEYTVTSIS
jgi:transcription elongation factor GreA